MKKLLFLYSSIFLLLLSVSGVAYAAFVDTDKVLGSTFTIGSSEIAFLSDIAGPSSSENLIDELVGPAFIGIYPGWEEDYLIKIYNNSGSSVSLVTNAAYDTVNDPQNIRQDLMVEVITWFDNNNDGRVDDLEVGSSLGKKTIVKWKTEGFDLGPFNADDTMGLILRFSADSIPDASQGSSAIFDFEFTATGAQ